MVTNMKKTFCRLAVTAALLMVSFAAALCEDKPIRNPYYKAPAWKLWDADATPIESKRLIAPGQVGKVAPLGEEARLYPDDAPATSQPATAAVTPAASFLAFRKGDWPGRKYAGFWDDVYLSVDNNGTNPPTPHSWMPNTLSWNPKFGTYTFPSLNDQMMAIYGTFGGTREFGVNFTSQSTTGMGHDIANNGPMLQFIEREMYFANCLRCGPAANGAHGEADYFLMQDLYEALSPCYFNSCGQSSSEVRALGKMMIVGGCLPKETKPLLKRNGLYIATLLYIWKASLPYDAPYESELRHRVAYSSAGDQLPGNYLVNRPFNMYDEAAHMANMVKMAKSMTTAPPISLIKKVELIGGTEKYFLKTTALVHQKKGETVKLRVSTADSYDLADKPLTFRWKVLYGSGKTTVEREGTSDTYVITVPPDEKLPKGRTSILLVANNGTYDSNPACINVYRPDGEVNRRPSIEGLADCAIFPGEKVTFDLKGSDPEGFPITFSRPAGQVGTLKDSTFTWDCPAGTPDGVYPVTIFASDGTGGTNSRQATISVVSTRARLSADKTSGPAPLAVKFSGAASADRKNSTLAYKWEFDDGATSTQAQPAHTFANPGFYRVKLTVTGPLGSHSAQTVIAAGHGWPLAMDNGWKDKQVDEACWNTKDLPKGVAAVTADKLVLSRPGSTGVSTLESVCRLQPPLYLELEFKKAWAMKGDGFDVLGCQLGFDGGDPSFVFQNAAAKARQPIGQYLSDPTREKATLRLYVTADPQHPGKARYSGSLDCLLGPCYFSFDDQAVAPAPLKAICTFASMELSRVQVWAPANSPAWTGPAPTSSTAPADKAAGR